MKTTNILLLAALLGGCAMGISHNVVTVDGKQYIAETKNFGVPYLPGIEWSEPTTYKEVKIMSENEEPGKLEGMVSNDTKTVLQTIYNECSETYRRDSFSVRKCIERKIKTL